MYGDAIDFNQKIQDSLKFLTSLEVTDSCTVPQASFSQYMAVCGEAHFNRLFLKRSSARLRVLHEIQFKAEYPIL